MPFRDAWDALQPALIKPRWWVAKVLRAFLWRTTFIAITGSNGKTTATRYLANILSTQAPTQWTRLNRNSAAGITETIAFCNPWKTRFAVFEVGFGKLGSIARSVSLVRPEIGVVLSVFLEHRVELRSLETAAREKADLVKNLPPGGIAVLNMDDPLVAEMPVPPGRKIIRVGASPEYDVCFENAESAWPQMLRFVAVVDGKRQEIHTRLLGTHWVGPILACIAVASHLGVPLDQIARSIAETPPYPGRMQVLRLPSGAVVIRDEFKGSRHTIDAAFSELSKAQASRKFLVFCDEAETSQKPRKRLAKIGRRVAQMVDFALFIGDRSCHGVRGAVEAGLSGDSALAFDDYRAASEFLRSTLGPGDVVLLKADCDHQLPRLLFSLVGEVRCTVERCNKPMVCDDCRHFRNPELVRRINEQLTV